MNNKKQALLLTMITLGYKYGDQYKIDFDDKYLTDEEIIDCQLTLYLLLLTHEGEKQNQMFKEFEEKYTKLSKEKQEYIREDLRKIFEEQDKNNKEKEKKLWEKQ